jgi:hypothetical protein
VPDASARDFGGAVRRDLGCAAERVGSGGQPTPTESLTRVLNSTQLYQRLGRLAAGEPLPFVGNVAFAAGPADSSSASWPLAREPGRSRSSARATSSSRAR